MDKIKIEFTEEQKAYLRRLSEIENKAKEDGRLAFLTENFPVVEDHADQSYSNESNVQFLLRILKERDGRIEELEADTANDHAEILCLRAELRNKKVPQERCLTDYKSVIDITPKMIDAGADCIMRHPGSIIPSEEDFRNVARDVYLAMTEVRLKCYDEVQQQIAEGVEKDTNIPQERHLTNDEKRVLNQVLLQSGKIVARGYTDAEIEEIKAAAVDAVTKPLTREIQRLHDVIATQERFKERLPLPDGEWDYNGNDPVWRALYYWGKKHSDDPRVTSLFQYPKGALHNLVRLLHAERAALAAEKDRLRAALDESQRLVEAMWR